MTSTSNQSEAVEQSGTLNLPPTAAKRHVGEVLVDDMTAAERERAARVDSVLGALAAASEQADRSGEFQMSHVGTLSRAGLLGLNVPTRYGGLGGGLRDLAAATFAMATACASTAIAYFFQCSATSRGVLPLAAIDAGLFSESEIPAVRGFAEKVLRRMGEQGRWIANFASESVRVKGAAIAIATRQRLPMAVGSSTASSPLGVQPESPTTT